MLLCCASRGYGELFDIDFQAHFLFAVICDVLVRGKVALHKQLGAFGYRPLNGFCLTTPGITEEPDGDVFHAAFRIDSKRELSHWRAILCKMELWVTFHAADGLHLNEHGIAPLAH